jgi:hypothetical protein
LKIRSGSAKRSVSGLERNADGKIICNLKNLKSNFVPKFRGCGPGGKNSSLMAKSVSDSRRSSLNYQN